MLHNSAEQRWTFVLSAATATTPVVDALQPEKKNILNNAKTWHAIRSARHSLDSYQQQSTSNAGFHHRRNTPACSSWAGIAELEHPSSSVQPARLRWASFTKCVVWLHTDSRISYTPFRYTYVGVLKRGGPLGLWEDGKRQVNYTFAFSFLSTLEHNALRTGGRIAATMHCSEKCFEFNRSWGFG